MIQLFEKEEMSRRLLPLQGGDHVVTLHSGLLHFAGRKLSDAREVMEFLVTVFTRVCGIDIESSDDLGPEAVLLYMPLVDQFDQYIDAIVANPEAAAEVKRIHAEVVLRVNTSAHLEPSKGIH